jgi:hypothetical protein
MTINLDDARGRGPAMNEDFVVELDELDDVVGDLEAQLANLARHTSGCRPAPGRRSSRAEPMGRSS